MSKYQQSALAEADAYEKERKQQAAEKIAQINAEAETKAQTALDEAGAAIQEQRQAVLDTVDTAAIERQVALGQATEAVARLGLTGSGLDAAHQRAAAVTETRRVQTARRTRDEAITALTEALTRREQEIAQERDAAVLAETQDAEQDALKQRNDLMEAAYKAEATENAAKTSAAQSAANKNTSVAQSKASRDETIRQDALKKLLSEEKIHVDVYIDAMKNGWSVEETRRRQVEWTAWRKISGTFVDAYQKQGYDAAIAAMAQYDMTERQLEDICFELNLNIDTVRADIAAKKKKSKEG